MSCGLVLSLLGVAGVDRSAVTYLLGNVASYVLPLRCGGKWELSYVGFGVVVARVKSGGLGFFGLQGSNLLESSLLVSLGISVTVLLPSLSSSTVIGVSVSLRMMDSSSSCLSGSLGYYCAAGLASNYLAVMNVITSLLAG